MTLAYDPAVALEHLRANDPTLGPLLDLVPFTLEPPMQRSVYEYLVRSIVSQQLSVKAAHTIFDRFVDLFDGPRFPLPTAVLAEDDERLRSAGLSRSKVAAIRDLSEKTAAGVLPEEAEMGTLSDDELIERVTIVRGIGRWTVEMLLIFRLGRPDVLPVDDLGVRKGFAVTYGTDSPARAAQLTAHSELWRPYRSVASWYMWRALETPVPAQ